MRQMGTYSPPSVIHGNILSVPGRAATQNTHDNQLCVRFYVGSGNIAGCLYPLKVGVVVAGGEEAQEVVNL